MPLIVGRPEHNDYVAQKLATSYYRAQSWLELGEWSLAARACRDVAHVWNRVDRHDRADLKTAGWSFLPDGLSDAALAVWIVTYERSKTDAYRGIAGEGGPDRRGDHPGRIPFHRRRLRAARVVLPPRGDVVVRARAARAEIAARVRPDVSRRA